ncbi:MAG TPA: hypothetical protein VHE59_17795 [Mucilaginibacter sp.]|nr:hypothetical protein [Mucilaginibacter sp.]
MKRLKSLRFMFSIAALLFVAKPFLGFEAFCGQVQPHISHTILVKSFTKRKPESLNDAYASASALRQMVSDPPLVLLPAIGLLLSFILPFLIESITAPLKKGLSNTLSPYSDPAPVYLLSGKLSI